MTKKGIFQQLNFESTPLTPITKHWDILFLCYILITVLGLSDFLRFFQLLLVEQSQEGDVVVDIEAGHHDAEEQETQGRGHDISLFFPPRWVRLARY